MKIGYGNIYDPVEESVLPSRAKARTEDGRTAPVSGSDLGVDSQAKNDDNKKTAFAVSGDRVEISKEARELYQAQASENASEEERQAHDKLGQSEHSDLSEVAEGLKGLSEKFMGPGASGAAQDEEGESGSSMVDKLRKQIKEVQKQLQEAQLKLQEAMSRANSEDPAASQQAEAEMQAAQQEVSALNSQLQMLQQQLQEAMSGSGGGGSGSIKPSVDGGWSPNGSRIQVGAEGITSLT